MARLPQLKSALPTLGSLRPGLRTAHEERDEAGWRKWYKTARWQKLRMATLKRDHFTCQMCGRLEGDTSLLVADHRRPHRGDGRLFWDPRNLWSLCKSPCHDSVKQREERRGAVG